MFQNSAHSLGLEHPCNKNKLRKIYQSQPSFKDVNLHKAFSMRRHKCRGIVTIVPYAVPSY
ncbi:hypothetical protein KUTeg_003749 [Tegillarca granosa]|uniref:Uncharacterized protein n=1 Tax=Tegillarca granosa TaxID=220873 RepID=A0ABQ9FSI1_TEGGR|nr:hypothetical protein KUTeg_003749 [Tegillarca granosa]